MLSGNITEKLGESDFLIDLILKSTIVTIVAVIRRKGYSVFLSLWIVSFLTLGAMAGKSSEVSPCRR